MLPSLLPPISLLQTNFPLAHMLTVTTFRLLDLLVVCPHASPNSVPRAIFAVGRKARQSNATMDETQSFSEVCKERTEGSKAPAAVTRL